MKKALVLFAFIFLYQYLIAKTNFAFEPDTIKVNSNGTNSELFYDSLKIKAHRHRFTRLLYDMLIKKSVIKRDKELISYEYYQKFEGKTIASIRIKRLDIFGPSFTDTTKVTKSKIGRFANNIHSRSSLGALRKNLLIKQGMEFNSNLLMDNERILRQLPYIKDVRFIITPRETNEQLIDVLLLTKDVFSYGYTGSSGFSHQNIWGIGHEISIKPVWHLEKEPNLGLETFYSISNFAGDFIDLKGGYYNTWKREGYSFSAKKEFLRPKTRWAGGINYSRNWRTDRISLNDPVRTTYPLDFKYLDVWYGRNLQLGISENDSRFQMTISGRVRNMYFIDRPMPDLNNNQYFANSTFYLGSISFSQRRYIRDHLIYSYGITEDIPKGYLHEIVVGYDDNEFTKRWYTHLYFSSGNLAKYRPYYLFASAGIGGYFNKVHYEQGQIEFNLDLISKLFGVGQMKTRQFFKLNYTIGIRRFEIENMLLRYDVGIRGFRSREAQGKQRLNLNMETTFFQNKEFLKFNTAFFSFLDIGMIGSNQKLIFTQDYYAGIGVGIRLRNENLVLKTLSIRLAYYPNHPSDIGPLGLMVEEQLKSNFYSFQPRMPEPLTFE